MNKKTKEVAVAVAPVEEKMVPIATTPMSLLQMAISQNVDMDKLERLMQMQEKWEAKKAKEAFFEALTNFQDEVPEIKKIRKVNFTGKNSSTPTKYNFASLGDIDKQIKSPLRKNGLAKRFEISEDKDQIIVTCLITHKDGHTEKTSMRGKLDDSGGKNEIQKAGSTITYLQRYSLLAALGITTAETDNDGQSIPANDGLDLPPIKDDEYNKAMKNIISGDMTVERVVANRSLTKEQLSALEKAQNSRNAKA